MRKIKKTVKAIQIKAGIVLVSLLILPIAVIIYLGFINPFYSILYNHLAAPCKLPYIFDVWIKSKNWSFLSAIGTICAISIAFFKDFILKYINRPKLDVLIEKKRPYIYNIPQSENGCSIGNTVYLSFQVINDGNSLAKNVAVKVKKINNETLDMFLTPEDIGVKIEKTTRDIPSKTGSYWNCIEIADPKFRKDNSKYRVIKNLPGNEPVLLIPLTYQLSTGNHIVKGGKYDIEILIVGDDIETIEKTILIDTSKLKEWPAAGKSIEEEEQEILKNITFEVLS